MVTMQSTQLLDQPDVAESRRPESRRPESRLAGSRLPEQRGRSASGDARQVPAVLVVDPDDRMEKMLRSVFAGPVVVRARSLAEAQRLTATAGPGPLAMVNMQQSGSAAEIIAGLRAAGWKRILALTDRGTEIGQILAAFTAGAGGVVRVADGGAPRRHPLDLPCQLSRREVEVVRLVADGLSNKAIGEQLSLSALTVKNHLARVGRKLGTGDRAHIVAIACRQGMILADN